MQFVKMVGYAIYDQSTKLFQRKGYRGWSKTPYIWSKLGYLKQHLSMSLRVDHMGKIIRPDPKYKDCVIMDMSTGRVFEGMTIKDYFSERANWLVSEGYNIIW